MTAIEMLKMDAFRLYGRISCGCILKAALVSRTFRVILTMRICQGLAHSNSMLRWTLPLFKILHRLASHSAALDLPWHTEIGGGLALTHGWGLVVSAGARIGNNATLFHGATIGRRDRIAHDGIRSTGYPTLEDDIWVGPHAIIVGGVVIGQGSRIAGGAFITESVPPYSIVIGNPAKVVKKNCSPDVMNPAPV